MTIIIKFEQKLNEKLFGDIVCTNAKNLFIILLKLINVYNLEMNVNT